MRISIDFTQSRTVPSSLMRLSSIMAAPARMWPSVMHCRKTQIATQSKVVHYAGVLAEKRLYRGVHPHRAGEHLTMVLSAKRLPRRAYSTLLKTIKGSCFSTEKQLPFSIQSSRNRARISSSVSSPRSVCSRIRIAFATAAFHSSTLIFPRTFLCFNRL